jgi:hypothetical protein
MPAGPVSRPWRRYLRFSVRRLIVLVLVIGVGLGWIVRQAHVQRDAVAAIREAGDEAWYDWEWKNGNPVPNGRPSWPKWLVDRIGVDYFGRVTKVYARRVADAELAQIGHFSQLECLLLGTSFVTDAGLAHLEGMSSLRALNLKHTRITDAGLAHLKKLTSLRALSLGDTGVSDAGLAHLAGLSHLTDLGLEETQVTDAGVRELQRALPNARIRR